MEITDKAKQLHCLELQLSGSKCLRAGSGQWWHCTGPRLYLHPAPSLISLPVSCGFSNKLPSLETNCGRNCSVSEDTTSPGEKISLLNYQSFLNASSLVNLGLMGLWAVQTRSQWQYCSMACHGSPHACLSELCQRSCLHKGVQEHLVSAGHVVKSVPCVHSFQPVKPESQGVAKHTRVGCIFRWPSKLLQMRPGSAYQSVSNLKGGFAVLLAKFSTVLQSQTPFLDTSGLEGAAVPRTSGRKLWPHRAVKVNAGACPRSLVQDPSEWTELS